MAGSVQEVVLNVPVHRREEHLKKWQEIAKDVFEKNCFGKGTGVRNIETDILFCSHWYAEPRFRYQDQELYWLNQPTNLDAMAHSKIFS